MADALLASKAVGVTPSNDDPPEVSNHAVRAGTLRQRVPTTTNSEAGCR
jgi:hypothetical protein